MPPKGLLDKLKTLKSKLPSIQFAVPRGVRRSDQGDDDDSSVVLQSGRSLDVVIEQREQRKQRKKKKEKLRKKLGRSLKDSLQEAEASGESIVLLRGAEEDLSSRTQSPLEGDDDEARHKRRNKRQHYDKTIRRNETLILKQANDLARLELAKAAQELEITKIKKQHQLAQRKIKEMQAELKRSKKVAVAEAKTNSTRQLAEANATAAKQMQAKVAHFKNEVARLSKQLTAAKKEAAESANKAAQEEVETLKRELQGARDKMREKKRLKDKHEKEVAELMKTLQEEKAKRLALEQEYQSKVTAVREPTKQSNGVVLPTISSANPSPRVGPQNPTHLPGTISTVLTTSLPTLSPAMLSTPSGIARVLSELTREIQTVAPNPEGLEKENEKGVVRTFVETQNYLKHMVQQLEALKSESGAEGDSQGFNAMPPSQRNNSSPGGRTQKLSSKKVAAINFADSSDRQKKNNSDFKDQFVYKGPLKDQLSLDDSKKKKKDAHKRKKKKKKEDEEKKDEEERKNVIGEDLESLEEEERRIQEEQERKEAARKKKEEERRKKQVKCHFIDRRAFWAVPALGVIGFVLESPQPFFFRVGG